MTASGNTKGARDMQEHAVAGLPKVNCRQPVPGPGSNQVPQAVLQPQEHAPSSPQPGSSPEHDIMWHCPTQRAPTLPVFNY